MKTDVDDPILGFTTRWIQEIAQHCEKIDVLSMYKGRVEVPDNVRVFSVGHEKGLSKPIRVMNFYAQLSRLLLTQSYDSCFCHMIPLFAGLGGVPLKARGIPITLWYTHKSITKQLEWGLRFSKNVVSAVPSSFPIETDKLTTIGHGIDTSFYQPDATVSKSKRPIILHVARLSPIKHQATLIRAMVNVDADAVIIG